MIKLKRIYDAREESDGHRVLVDRLWPRGVKKEAAALEEWLRDIAPSPQLRKWFGHDPARWDEFVKRYRRELASADAAPRLAHLRQLSRKGTLTLLYAAREERHNSAVVLRDVLESGAA
jgi:uncharacterized protein YeaO (DUF488 family)